MESIDPLFFRDVRLEVGAVGYRHPVVLRVTPWSVTLVSNPCAELPGALRFLATCDCQDRLENLLLRSDDLLHRWSLGDDRSQLEAVGKRLAIPVEIRSAVEAFLTLAAAGPAGREPSDRLPAAECLLQHQLDSDDPGWVWCGLQTLRGMAHERVQAAIQPRWKRAAGWPLGLRLLVLGLTEANPITREESDRVALLAATVAEPGLGPVARQRLLMRIPVRNTEMACRILLNGTRKPAALRGGEVGKALERILADYVAEDQDAATRVAVTRLVVELLMGVDRVSSTVELQVSQWVDELFTYLRENVTDSDRWSTALRLLGCARSLEGGLAILKLVDVVIDHPGQIDVCLSTLAQMDWNLSEKSERTLDFLLAVRLQLDRVKLRLARGFGPNFRWEGGLRRSMSLLADKLKSTVPQVARAWDPRTAFELLLDRVDARPRESEHALMLRFGAAISRASGSKASPCLVKKAADSST